MRVLHVLSRQVGLCVTGRRRYHSDIIEAVCALGERPATMPPGGTVLVKNAWPCTVVRLVLHRGIAQAEAYPKTPVGPAQPV